MMRVMMYDERMVAPMREELTSVGFEDLRSAEEVDAAIKGAEGTALVVVNSVCGCAARMARPAIRHALAESEKKPERLMTVFAGQDVDATNRARQYFTGYPPSSPSMALLRNGQLVWMLERWQIEGRPASDIAADLEEAFDKYC